MNEQKIYKGNPNYYMDYNEIAEIMGISASEVRKIEKEALRKLRHPRIGIHLKRILKEG